MWPHSTAWGFLAPALGVKPWLPAVESQSLNHWTTREVHNFIFLNNFFKETFSVQFSRSVVADSLRPHEPQHARPPCPSPTPGVHPNPCPSRVGDAIQPSRLSLFAVLSQAHAQHAGSIPWRGNWTCAPALGPKSPNHWTARDVPRTNSKCALQK